MLKRPSSRWPHPQRLPRLPRAGFCTSLQSSRLTASAHPMRAQTFGCGSAIASSSFTTEWYVASPCRRPRPNQPALPVVLQAEGEAPGRVPLHQELRHRLAPQAAACQAALLHVSAPSPHAPGRPACGATARSIAPSSHRTRATVCSQARRGRRQGGDQGLRGQAERAEGRTARGGLRVIGRGRCNWGINLRGANRAMSA